jgi:hypothetical protein
MFRIQLYRLVTFGPDTQRRLEDSRAVCKQPVFLREVLGSTRYSLGCCVLVAQFLLRLCWLSTARVVETRRLELLTLSLQRRCSSD